MPSTLSRPLRIFVPHSSEVLTDHLPNGDGQIAYGFLRSLAERGHDLQIASSRLEVKAPLHPNMHVHVIETAHKGPRGRLEYMQQVRGLFHRLKEEKSFDLIHQTNPVFAGVSLAVFGSGLPLVLGTLVARWPADPHSLAAKGGLKGALAPLGRDAIATLQQIPADILLLTSPAARNRIPLPALIEKKIRMIGHGIDAELFSPAPDFDSDARLEAEQRNPVVLFLANIALRKGIVPLMQAWKTVVEHVPNARLAVVGGGGELQRMKDLALEQGVTGSVDFLGPKARVETPDFYRNSAMYVLPSLGEPYATSVLEAMSCGRPVIVTNAGGLPALMPPQGGLLVPMNDAPALAAAIVDLLQHPEKRRAMGVYNRQYVLENMTWQRIVDKLEGYYAELVPDAAPKR